MIQAASQVASSISHLKSKYLNYLETLCSANGIDISTLKSNGSDIKYIEIFFGGLPVLVGLKYFTNLTVLKIFGQNITCIKSLSEVAGTLEELWICEGRLKDLSGMEACTKLRKLYLYENSIDDASSLASLSQLDTLHLEMNRLKSLEFLQSLSRLHHLNLACNKMHETELATLSYWPMKLQFLDISGNHIRRPQVLAPLSTCTSLRHFAICSQQFPGNHLADNMLFFEWIAHTFRFIESLDDDDVSEQFTTLYLPQTETRVAETMIQILKIKENEENELKIVEKHCLRIESKLSRLCDALQKLGETLPLKDGRREVVKRVLDVAHTNLMSLKSTKKSFKILLSFNVTMRSYTTAMTLECCGIPGIRPSEAEEIEILTAFLNQNMSNKQSFEIFVNFSVTTRTFHKSDAEKLFILDRNEQSRVHNARSITGLSDHHFRKNYRQSVKIFKDFQLIKKEAKEKTTVFFLPIVNHKPAHNVASSIDKETKTNQSATVSTDNKINDQVSWSNLRLVAICAVELRYIGVLHTNHLRHMDQFDASFDEQQKKLKEMSIKVDLKDEKLQKKITEETTESTIETLANKAKKVRCARELLTQSDLEGRWGSGPGYSNILTARNPVDLVLSYGQTKILSDTTDFTVGLIVCFFNREVQLTVTTLDLSDTKLTKLSGIEELHNLMYLSVKKNKLSSLIKLRGLQCLRYLDSSENHITKLDHLPNSLIELNLANNRLASLQFCQELQILERLNVSNNHIKSVAGIENCKLLEILLMSDNHIKDKIELDTLKCCTKLWFVDLTNCPLTNIDGYKIKMHVNHPYLLSLDRQMIPLEEKHLAHKRAGRSLTVEFVEKCYPDWAELDSISLCNHKLEVIVLENGCLQRLSHLVSLDLSSNQLQTVKELGGLTSLKKLVLKNNSVRVICSAAQDNNVISQFISLEELSLSENEISQSMFNRLGLQHLRRLKKLNLAGNGLVKVDAPLFDLPLLEELNVSDNQIKLLTRKPFLSLQTLILSNNKLKTMDGLVSTKLVMLNVANNKISTCAGLKPLSILSELKELDCTGNTVTEKRVYVDYVKNQISSLKVLDGKPIEEHHGLPEVRHHRSPSVELRKSEECSHDTGISISSHLSVSSFDLTRCHSPNQYSDWLLPEDFSYKNSNIASRRNSSFMSTESVRSSSPEFMLQGVKATKHRKL